MLTFLGVGWRGCRQRASRHPALPWTCIGCPAIPTESSDSSDKLVLNDTENAGRHARDLQPRVRQDSSQCRLQDPSPSNNFPPAFHTQFRTRPEHRLWGGGREDPFAIAPPNFAQLRHGGFWRAKNFILCYYKVICWSSRAA
jgi:hypothetical protein